MNKGILLFVSCFVFFVSFSQFKEKDSLFINQPTLKSIYDSSHFKINSDPRYVLHSLHYKLFPYAKTPYEAYKLNLLKCNAYLKLNANDSALVFLNQAIKTAQLAHFKDQISGPTRTKVGILINQGKLDEALDICLSLLKTDYQKSDSIGIARDLNYLGIIYKDQDKLEQAEKTLLEGIFIVKQSRDSMGYTPLLNNLGVTYRKMKDYDKAIECYNESYKISILNKDLKMAAFSLSNLGVSYEKKKNYNKSISYHLEALKIRLQIKDYFGLTQTYMNIGNVYYWTKDYNRYVDYQLKALEIAKQQNAQFNLKDIYYNLSYAYRKEYLNNPSKELEYLKKHYELKDSIKTDETEKKLARAEVTYEYEKKLAIEQFEQKKREELVAKDLAIQQNISILSLVIISILFILTIVLYRNNLYKKKTAKLLELQKNEIKKQKDLVEYKSNQITLSIDYARKIQNAFIQSEYIIQKTGLDYFVLNKPKDIVSGDFFWANQKDDQLFLAVVDCTGHGVPGAFMSLIAYKALELSVTEKKILEPDKIIKSVYLQFEDALKKNNNDKSYEGLEMIICKLDLMSKRMSYAGSRQKFSLYNELKGITTFKIDSGLIVTSQTEFKKQELQVSPGDTLLLYSDGYVDQIGQQDKRRLYHDNFEKLLIFKENQSLEDKKHELDDYFTKWKGTEDQCDDIIVFGLKI